jgi:hypothetical protein
LRVLEWERFAVVSKICGMRIVFGLFKKRKGVYKGYFRLLDEEKAQGKRGSADFGVVPPLWHLENIYTLALLSNARTATGTLGITTNLSRSTELACPRQYLGLTGFVTFGHGGGRSICGEIEMASGTMSC